MAFSSARYTGDGVTKDFTVTFDYLDQSHVKARVNKVFTDAVGSNYKITWINPTTLRVDTVIDGNAPLSGEEIELIRQTPIDSPAVVFGGGASLSSENLNKNSEYLTYALQEATDDNEAFTKLYLGSTDAFPTTDNDGEALQVGSVIYYTPEDALYYYTSLGTWVVGESTIAAQQFRDQAEAARDIAVAAQADAESAKSGAESAQVAAAASAVTASGHATTAGLEKDAAVVAKDAALAALAASDRQPLDATLTLLSGKTVTAAGLALLDDASVAAQRTTLGLGNIATTDLIDEDDMVSNLATRAPTQQSVKAYVDALPGGIGVGQTWQNLTGSRLVATVYQNTTGRPIMVHIQSTSAAISGLSISTTGAFAGEEVEIFNGDSSGFSKTISAIIPDAQYYRLESGGFANWSELR